MFNNFSTTSPMKTLHRIHQVAMAVAAAAALAACGGGSDAAAPTEVPEGFWSGTTSTGATVNTLILENGDMYALYSQSGVVYGAVQGKVSGGGGNFSIADARDFSLAYGRVLSGSISGTYSARGSIAGRINYPELSQTTSFSGSYDARYDTAASLATVAGTWRGSSYTGETVTVTINAAGALSGSSSRGCTFTGTATPRPTGKNVYNTTVLFTSAACALGTGTSVSGVSIAVGGQLVSIGVNADRTNGLLFLGAKVG